MSYVVVSISRETGEVTAVYGPFSNGRDADDWMQESRTWVEVRPVVVEVTEVAL